MPLTLDEKKLNLVSVVISHPLKLEVKKKKISPDNYLPIMSMSAQWRLG